MRTGQIHKAHILPLIAVHVLVYYRAAPLLVLVVAVHIGDFLLYQPLGLGYVYVRRRVASLLVLHHKVNVPVLVERIPVIVVAADFLEVPLLLWHHIFLGANAGNRRKKQQR